MNVAVSKDRLEASICRESFYDFVQRFWDVIIPEEPVWNWHIPYLCKELQIVAERVFRGEPKKYDLIINVPPGSTKSTICSIMFPAWVWTRMPHGRTICGSHTATLSMDLARRSRMVVLSDKYQQLWPEIELSEDQYGKSHYVNTAKGERQATMVGGAITGEHAHFIIVDDPLDPQRAASELELKSANDWMRETLSTRKVDKALTPTILIMQRLHQDDPTGERLARIKDEDGRVRHICLPATVSEKVSPQELKDRYVDGLLDPVRLSQEILDEMEEELGPFGYAAQFDENPIPRGGGEFKTERISIEPAPPKHFVARVRYWDKAGTKGGGAHTAGVLMGKDRKGQFWVLNVKKGQWGAVEREDHIEQTAAVDGEAVRIYVEQEPASGGKESAENTIRRLAGYKIYADLPGGRGSKEVRAEPFVVQVGGENVCMVRGEWNHDYLEELRYWPNSKYKDQVDASSGAFAQLAKRKKIVGSPGRGMLKGKNDDA